MSNFYDANSSAVGDARAYGKQQYVKQQYDSGLDSGFSDTFSSIPPHSVFSESANKFSSVPSPPAPPHLILMEDVEDSDSGITVDDAVEIEKDCACTFQRKQQTMDVGHQSSSVASRGSGSRSPKAKRPRFPRKTVHGPFSTTSSSSSTIHTVSARSSSPKSVYITEPHSSTQTFSTAPFTLNKENQGPSTLPAMRSSSPLARNNFQSLNERVPPIGANTGYEVYHFREYMNFFLPDTKEGDT